MSEFFDPGHPVQRLVFFVAQDTDDSIRVAVGAFIESLAGLREWTIAPPSRIIDEDDASLVGGCVEIYSARPPNVLPREVDLNHLEEVSTIVSSVERFSYEHMLAFEFELEGEFVGAVEDGKIDHSLREGLLGEWKRKLNA